MTTFDKREEGFEKKFALDEELKFKAEGPPQQAVGIVGRPKSSELSGDAADDYAKTVVAAEFGEGGDDAVVRKVMADLAAKGVAAQRSGNPRQDGRADGAGRSRR